MGNPVIMKLKSLHAGAEPHQTLYTFTDETGTNVKLTKRLCESVNFRDVFDYNADESSDDEMCSFQTKNGPVYSVSLAAINKQAASQSTIVTIQDYLDIDVDSIV
jgi:hypothetical protein